MDDPFYADCPHCERTEFSDEDDFFYHVSMCTFDQERDGEDAE